MRKVNSLSGTKTAHFRLSSANAELLPRVAITGNAPAPARNLRRSTASSLSLGADFASAQVNLTCFFEDAGPMDVTALRRRRPHVAGTHRNNLPGTCNWTTSISMESACWTERQKARFSHQRENA